MKNYDRTVLSAGGGREGVLEKISTGVLVLCFVG